ncbi:MAG: IS256 family transposase [Candidatus Dormibacteria bacterium]
MTVAEREEAARVARLPAEATIALADVAGAIREGLLAFCCSAGLLAVSQIMEEEMTAKVGPKGRHDPDRPATRNGSAPGSVALGGRSVPLRRPRASLTDGGELVLDSYAVFSGTDLLTQLAMERMLAGVATRRHGLVAEPIGTELEERSKGDSRSAVSRRFVSASKAKLAELLGRDLSALDVAALMIDGIVFAQCCCVTALVITTDGTKVPVGVWEGDTENARVVTDLLADLVERGLRYEVGVLVVIDGAKALAAGVKRVFGRHAVTQRCVLHKRRNVGDYLDPITAKTVDSRLAKAFNDADWARGKKVAEGIARQLEAKHPGAAASMREGLEEMFTVRRLGVPDRLARTMSCTNAIESMISVVQSLTRRVKRWRDPKMVRRWAGVGMIEAERSFRRVKGCRDMAILVAAVRSEVAHRLAEDEVEKSSVTPKAYAHSAA